MVAFGRRYVALKVNSVVRLSSALMAMALIPTAVVVVPAWPDHVLAVQSALVVNQSDTAVHVHAVSGNLIGNLPKDDAVRAKTRAKTKLRNVS